MPTMFMILMTGLFALQDAPPSDPPQADGEVDLLEENRRLQEEVARLRKELEEKEAEYIQTLREMHEKSLRLRKADPAPIPSTPDPEPENENQEPLGAPLRNVEEGPDHEIRGSIRSINRTGGTLVLNRGESDGVKVGYLFEILREATGSSPRIALARVEKFLGANRDMSWLALTEGDIERVKLDDTAVAIRKTPESKPGDPPPLSKPVVGKSTFEITGQAGDRYVTDFGATHGAKLTMKVYIRRNGNLIGTLRLDDVKNDYSIGTVLDSDNPFQTGDRVEDKEPRKPLYGRIRWNDEERGIIIDLGTSNGAEAGMRFEARRNGQPVGYMVITSVDRFTSYVEPVDGSTRETFQNGDLVEYAPAEKKN